MPVAYRQMATGDHEASTDSKVTISALPATPERWDDLVAVFGRRGNDPGWCWCQRFMKPSTDNRESLCSEVRSSSVPPGVLAYVDGTPAGWSRVMPRVAVPLVQRNRALRRVLTAEAGAWWITCFAVHRQYRSIGVGKALLGAAVAHAAHHGATAIEGHPVDTDALEANRVDASALYTGTMRTFLACDFREIGRTYPSRPVVRRNL